MDVKCLFAREGLSSSSFGDPQAKYSGFDLIIYHVVPDTGILPLLWVSVKKEEHLTHRYTTSLHAFCLRVLRCDFFAPTFYYSQLCFILWAVKY